MRRRPFAGLLLGAVLLAAGCSASGPRSSGPMPPPAPGLSYTADVQPLFDAKCTRCHGAGQAAQGLRLDSWAHLFAGSDDGEAVIPFDAAHSLLLHLATARVGEAHPAEAGADTLTRAEIDRLTRWVNDGARNDDGTVPFADAQSLLYVANQGDALVSIIDADAGVVIRTVDLQRLGFSANAKPHHIAVEPDGSFWYLSLIGENKVLKFNRANELVGQADFEVPGMLALDPTSDRLYVGRSMSAVNPPQRIGRLQRSDMSIDEIDVFFGRPHALTVDPSGRYVYAASLSENRIARVDTETDAVELTSVDGTHQMLVQFADAPDGRTLVAGGQMSGEVLFFDASAPDGLALLGRVPVKAQPWHPVFSPDGRTVYLGNKEANTVTVLDVAGRRVAAVIEGEGLAQPHGAALSPDGRFLYVSNNNLSGAYTPRYPLRGSDPVGTVVVIDTATNTLVKVIEVGHYPTGMGMRAAPATP